MANSGKLVALRTNSQPKGGVTATSGVQPILTPADIAALVQELQPVISRFRQASTPQSVTLQQTNPTLGTDTPARIASVGLGWRTVTLHTVVFTVTFSGAGSVFLDPWFPFSLIANSTVAVNGSTVVFSTDGPGTVASYARTRKGFWLPYYGVSSAGSLAPSFVNVAVTGTNVTTTAATAYSICGYSKINASAATTATVTCNFITINRLAYSRDTLLGALPLQNNSVFATISHRPVAALVGATTHPKSGPLYNATAVSGSALTSWTSTTEYDFWAVPNDPSLYQDMVNNSFQVLQQPNVTASSTGALAFTYPWPQNQYAVAMHMVGFDGNGDYLANGLLNPALGRLLVQYNGGSVIPVTQYRAQTLAAQFGDYGADLSVVPGYYLWDGDDTAESLTTTDDAGWLDTYSAATPQVAADVAAATATPLSVNMTREIVVSGAVQTVGGA